MKSNSLLWIGAIGLVAVIAVVLLYMRSTRYNFAADLNLHFPPNSFDNVVDEESFTKIVNLESKPYDGIHKTHILYYCGRSVTGGVPGQPPSLDVGHHVTQYVSFADMQHLENFLKETQSSTPTPCKE